MGIQAGRGKPGRGPRGVARRTTVVVCTALAALAAAASALAAHPTKGGHYKGKTAQGKQISFAVSKSGKGIVDAHLSLVTTCFAGGRRGHSTLGYSPKHNGVPVHVHSSIRADGKFSFQAVFPKHHYPAKPHHAAYTASGTLTISGRFVTASRATGTMRGSARYYPPYRETCSGSTRFAVTR